MSHCPELHLCKHHLDGHVTAQIHLPLLTATLVLQLEPGKDVVVSANIAIVAEPAIKHANTTQRIINHRPHADPYRIISTVRSETSTTTRHRDAYTPAAGQPVDEMMLEIIDEEFPAIGFTLSQTEL